MEESQNAGKLGTGVRGGGGGPGAFCGPRWGPGVLPMVGVRRRRPLKLKAFSKLKV